MKSALYGRIFEAVGFKQAAGSKQQAERRIDAVKEKWAANCKE